MLEEFFEEGAVALRLRADRLGPHLDTFSTLVSRLGYARSSARAQLNLLVDLGQWLKGNALGVGDLGAAVVERFVVDRRGAWRPRRSDARTLRRFLAHLRAGGVLPTVQPQIEDSALVLLKTRFEAYLITQRGLVVGTGLRYWPFVRDLLLERFGEKPIRVHDLTAHDITRFLLRHVQDRTPKGAQPMVSALRSFLRFLFRHGETECDLSAAVLTVASWRLAEVPKYLKPAAVECLLASCDRSSPIGRRDYALLLLLARLGLRAGEVVTMELDDLDWRLGELTVRGKGASHDRLPLPADVGDALAAYLRQDRPPCATRRVFVCMKAPCRGFHHASTVSTIVRRALERAGLNPPGKGAHLLRHSLATGMLRNGASLAEIGEILRHRALTTTEIYAKVDIEGLRTLARPWPAPRGAR